VSSRDTTNRLRPDFSEYVVHFTKDDRPWSTSRSEPSAAVVEIAKLTARDRFASILKQRVITAMPMPYTNKLSVCFTECVWASLLMHADRSPASA
jgi:hypothetical protein